ncbi:adenylate/guanylate cyclase domain-containing protein [Nocardioides sp. R-C-SC26]|uniref:adenylate/guanylate cyclase domain-containing protein n=1 Tax=Nocardioides sp. R-C-SC26 TaxID=2870414 RepID=UPI001E5642C6|nr:adenylate/guanylate cyclase domain-containing protein [Nocardioides sp. R-C-SC26]
MTEPTDTPAFAGLLATVESDVLGLTPTLTRLQVAAEAEVPLEVATALWSLLGFAHVEDTAVAFTEDDVEALRAAHELVGLGILSPDRQAALVRTWGRSFARLAEWQTDLLADVALESGGDPRETLPALVSEVLPRVEELQRYIWRRHLASAGSRILAVLESDAVTERLAVVFVDIVGYTARSKTLGESELVAWLEAFEDRSTSMAGELGGRVIKSIGDEVLVVLDDPVDAVTFALRLTAMGADEDDPFPEVRAGVAFGEVVARLGDVFGATVNVAARLTSAARPGAVLVDRGVYDALHGEGDGEPADEGVALDDEHAAGTASEGPGDDGSDRRRREPHEPREEAPFSFRRVRRLHVKGYDRLAAYAVRARAEHR